MLSGLELAHLLQPTVAFELRRPTKDIDLEATFISNDVVDVSARIHEIAAIDLDDGIIFEADSVRAETI